MNHAAKQSIIPAWLQPAPDSMAAYMRRCGRRPKLQAFNLLWSAWLLAPMFFMPVGWPFFVSLALSFPLFLLLFVLVHVRPYQELRYYSSALVLLGCACMPFSTTAWTYGIYGCVYVPYEGDLRPSILWMLLEELVMVAMALTLGWPWEMHLVLIGICSSAGFGGLMNRVNAMKNSTERLSRDEVRRLAANAERERIGRDLHDLLGHTLSLITLKLELSRKLFDRDPEQARKELGEAEEVARHALAEVRSAVTGIRATGLAGELASARLMLRSAGVEFDVGDMPALPAQVDDTLAWVLREAVTNIQRHSRAEHASVTVEVAAEHVVMRIGDDGNGCRDEAGNGLTGMRERVRALDGSLQIQSAPGAGTQLRIDIPLLARRAQPDVAIDVGASEQTTSRQLGQVRGGAS